MCVPFPVSTIDTLAGSFGSLAYVYDKNGNRQSETRNAGVINYTYTPVGSNWLYQSGSTPRPKTANGNTHAAGNGTLPFTVSAWMLFRPRAILRAALYVRC
jgi:hypothetical protein